MIKRTDKFDAAVALLEEASTDFAYQGIKRLDSTPQMITLFDILMKQQSGTTAEQEIESNGEIFNTVPVKKAIIDMYNLNKSNRNAYEKALDHPLVKENPDKIEKISDGIKRCAYIEQLLKAMATDFDVFKI